ncbi:MAG: class IIb bacteriocin, lactobin A/cerein 7B family [Bacteroidales bacterium]|nr:class IIb bacteriocin, lactobin A/cerein 7B family [Bacteroidales bacterium]
MKTLDLNELESINGGSRCGKIGAIFGVSAAVLMVAALATNPATLAGGLVLAHSISFGIVGGGCGIIDLF